MTPVYGTRLVCRKGLYKDDMKQISTCDLVPFDLFTGDFPIAVDLVYADAAHPENVFGALYHPDALMWGHIELVSLTLYAACTLRDERGWTLIVKDCLRPVEAQQKMCEADIVCAHPHWIEEPRFISPPGQGGHPRGMAVDLAAIDDRGQPVDFGTAFDAFADSSDPEHNPAHRAHPYLREEVKFNRSILDHAMQSAAQKAGHALLLLSTEWWDFRFSHTFSNLHAPLADSDLLPWQSMVAPDVMIPEKERVGMISRVINFIDKFDDL